LNFFCFIILYYFKVLILKINFKIIKNIILIYYLKILKNHRLHLNANPALVAASMFSETVQFFMLFFRIFWFPTRWESGSDGSEVNEKLKDTQKKKKKAFEWANDSCFFHCSKGNIKKTKNKSGNKIGMSVKQNHLISRVYLTLQLKIIFILKYIKIIFLYHNIKIIKKYFTLTLR
jgi:hypothetical protein